MICKFCQKALHEGYAYCIHCGKAQEPALPVPMVYPPGVPPVMMYPVPNVQFPARPLYYPPNFVTRTIKQLARTPLFSISILFVMVTFLCTAVTIILRVAENRALYDPLSFDIYRIFETGANGGSYPWLALMINSTSLFISLLSIISLLKISTAARKPGASLASGTGLLYRTSIMNYSLLCVNCIVSLFSLAVNGIGSVFGQNAPMSDSFFRLGSRATFEIIFGIIFALTLLSIIHAFVIAGFSHIKKSVETGVPSARYVTYIGVMLFIGSFFSLIILLGAFLNLFISSNFWNVTLQMILALSSGLSSLFMGILLCRYSFAVRAGILPMWKKDIA